MHLICCVDFLIFLSNNVLFMCYAPVSHFKNSFLTSWQASADDLQLISAEFLQLLVDALQVLADD